MPTYDLFSPFLLQTDFENTPLLATQRVHVASKLAPTLSSQAETSFGYRPAVNKRQLQLQDKLRLAAQSGYPSRLCVFLNRQVQINATTNHVAMEESGNRRHRINNGIGAEGYKKTVSR